MLCLWLSAILAVTTADVKITKTWNGGFQANACVDITHELPHWTGSLVFSKPVDAVETYTAENQRVDSTHYSLSGKPWNKDEHSGDHFCVDFLARLPGTDYPSVTLVIDGINGGSSGHNNGGTGHQTQAHTGHTNAPVVVTGSGNARYNYADALSKAILFYDAQRSGKLPANNPIKWRGDSALGDKGDGGHDLSGGWYDAGDHVKFNLPMASTSTLLLWSYLQWHDGYGAAKQTNMFFDMIKTPLDYYLKCWVPPSTLYAQVGDGNADHSFWGRPEDMHMSRPAYKLTPSKPGADVAGEMAASLAAGYMAFKTKNSGYANKLLAAAKGVYNFGKQHPGTYMGSVPNIGQFYSSSGYKDEMCEGAMWLYKATKDAKYLADAKGYYQAGPPWSLSWDDKKLACQMLLYEETKGSNYKNDIEQFFKSWMPGGSIKYTPCGQAWRDKWGSNRYAGNAAFAALMAADLGIDTNVYRKWAAQQINYLLGDNKYGISFEIGFGSKYPRSPHHRGASCPDRPAPCSDANLHSGGASPQLLVGALVGGPDQGDNYKDSREDYVQNEVACDYNSGFTSALAGLTKLVHDKHLPAVGNPKCHG